MNKISLVFAGLISLLLFGCSPKLNVIPAGSKSKIDGKQGVYYALPRTILSIEVTVNKTEQIKGPYAEFAGKYLGLTNVIMSNAVGYDIRGIKIMTCTEPDPGQYYFIEFKNGKAIEDFSPSFSASGILLSSGGEVPEVVSDPPFFTMQESSNEYPDIFKYYADLNLFEKIDTIIEKVSTDTVTVEKMILKRSMVEKTAEQKASDAADFIIKVKANRFNLLSGDQEVNYDKETFRYMNEELERMENEYRKLFMGITISTEQKYVFRVVPSGNSLSDSIPLFRFSHLKGILDTNAAYGDLFYTTISSCRLTDSVARFEKLRRTDASRQHGLFYRMPEYGIADVLSNGKSMINGRFLICQYGVLTCLPARQPKVIFFPYTGGISGIR